MKRRAFIQSSCTYCLLGAAGFVLPQLTGCGPAYHVIKMEISDNRLIIPLSNFVQSTLVFIRPKGWYYDISVEKKENNSYQALLLQCTHQRNQVLPTGNGFLCSLHGSQFDKNGKVIKGPAESSLKQFSTRIDQDNLVINLKDS